MGREIISNISFWFGYIGYSYLIYTLMQVINEWDISIENKQKKNTVKKALSWSLSRFIVLLVFVSIVPLVIWGVDDYFSGKRLNRCEREWLEERKEKEEYLKQIRGA